MSSQHFHTRHNLLTRLEGRPLYVGPLACLHSQRDCSLLANHHLNRVYLGFNACLRKRQQNIEYQTYQKYSSLH